MYETASTSGSGTAVCKPLLAERFAGEGREVAVRLQPKNGGVGA